MQSACDTTGFSLQVERLPPATEAEVYATSRPFERGWGSGSQSEALTLELSRKLHPFIGRIKEKHYAGVAKLAKELTKNRSVGDALQYLKSDLGTEWIQKYLVPSRGKSMNGVVGQQAVGDATPGTVPTTMPFPSSSPANNVCSPLIPKAEHPEYQHTQVYRAPRGGLPVGVAGLRWFALIFFVVLAVWVISILPELALSLG